MRPVATLGKRLLAAARNWLWVTMWAFALWMVSAALLGDESPALYGSVGGYFVIMACCVGFIWGFRQGVVKQLVLRPFPLTHLVLRRGAWRMIARRPVPATLLEGELVEQVLRSVFPRRGLNRDLASFKLSGVVDPELGNRDRIAVALGEVLQRAGIGAATMPTPGVWVTNIGDETWVFGGALVVSDDQYVYADIRYPDDGVYVSAINPRERTEHRQDVQLTDGLQRVFAEALEHTTGPVYALGVLMRSDGGDTMRFADGGIHWPGMIPAVSVAELIDMMRERTAETKTHVGDELRVITGDLRSELQ